MVIMHISDLHFGISNVTKGNYVRNRQMVLDSFLDHLSELPQDLVPDILVITGDIGYSGSKEDYIKAKTFIQQVIDKSNGKLTTNDIIICPGNHDVLMPPDRRKELRPTKDVLSNLDLDPLVRENIASSIYKFENYIQFLKDLNICELHNKAKTSGDDNSIRYLYGYREIKGIQFVVLNSEWGFWGKSDKQAEGCLRLGADLVEDALENVEDCDNSLKPIIAIFHRPIMPNIHISERNDYRNDLHNVDNRLNSSADIILNGHVHIGKFANFGKRAWSFSCGTLHSVDVEVPEYWLFEFENNTYKARKYKWSLPNIKHRNGIWLQDPNDDYSEFVWTLGQINPLDTEEQHLEILSNLIKSYNEQTISKHEAIVAIQEKLPICLQDIAYRLFDQAIANASDKNITSNNSLAKGFEKELLLGDIRGFSENSKEDKTKHE